MRNEKLFFPVWLEKEEKKRYIFKSQAIRESVWFPVWRLADWHTKVPHFFPVKREKGHIFESQTDKEADWFPVWRFSKVPHFFPVKRFFSPLFPHKWEVGKLRKKCHNVPNLSGECLKMRDFEVQSKCPNTAATSTIFELKTATIVAIFYHIRFQFPTDGLF